MRRRRHAHEVAHSGWDSRDGVRRVRRAEAEPAKARWGFHEGAAVGGGRRTARSVRLVDALCLRRRARGWLDQRDSSPGEARRPLVVCARGVRRASSHADAGKPPRVRDPRGAPTGCGVGGGLGSGSSRRGGRRPPPGWEEAAPVRRGRGGRGGRATTAPAYNARGNHYGETHRHDKRRHRRDADQCDAPALSRPAPRGAETTTGRKRLARRLRCRRDRHSVAVQSSAGAAERRRRNETGRVEYRLRRRTGRTVVGRRKARENAIGLRQRRQSTSPHRRGGPITMRRTRDAGSSCHRRRSRR